MRIKSIRARLTFWYTGLLSVTFLILAGASFWFLAYTLAHDVDTSLNGVARVLVEQARKNASPFIPPDIDDVFRRFFGFSPLDRYFEMLDPTGRRDPRRSFPRSGKLPLSRKALNNASQGLHTFETVEYSGKYPVRVLTVPVIEAGRVVNMVQVGMSLESMYVTRRRFLVVTLAVLPVALLFAGGGGWLLARRALKPVDSMAEAAERISAEALSDRLEESGSGDELDRLAKTLNSMLGRLDAAFSQIRQFSADASHELQTPLTILKGEMEVALRSPRDPEEYQRVLNSALEEVDRIARLVEGLLLLSRADAGVLKMDRRSMDLGQLVEEVYGQVKILADTQNINLLLGQVASVSIRGDQEHLRRLLLNLVDNGIKYTPSGGQVTISLQEDGGWVSVKIEDTGIGISSDDQERLFLPFYRAGDARLRGKEGVGLGLSIAKSIAEAHGAKINIESTVGQGSVFTVLFPVDS
jgi:heavy metal sensor kinase